MKIIITNNIILNIQLSVQKTLAIPHKKINVILNLTTHKSKDLAVIECIYK